MSKTLKVLILTLFVSASVFAQRPDREKIKVLKIAHITEQLDLTKVEAQKFWPIYNAHEDARNKLQSKLLNDLLEILPAKKIIKLYQAERSFKEKMLEEYKKRYSGERGPRKMN